jgi:hypothetical protein
MQYIIGSKEFVPADSEMIPVLDEAIGITAAKLIPAAGDFKDISAVFAWLSFESGGVRLKVDGTDPIALTDGHLIAADDTIMIHGIKSLANLRMIREDGGESPVVQVSIYWPGRKNQ